MRFGTKMKFPADVMKSSQSCMVLMPQKPAIPVHPCFLQSFDNFETYPRWAVDSF